MCFLRANCRVSSKPASSNRLRYINCILWFRTSMCIFCQKRSSISGHFWCKFYNKSSMLALLSQHKHRQKSIKNSHKQNHLKEKIVKKMYWIIKNNLWLRKFKLFQLLNCNKTSQYNLCWKENSQNNSNK